MIRVVTTILLAIGVLSAIWYLPQPLFKLFVFVAIILGLWEYGKLVFDNTYTRLLTLFLGMSVSFCLIWRPNEPLRIWSIFVLSVFCAFLWEMRDGNPSKNSLSKAALIILGVAYLSVPFPFWCWIREMGREWVMLLLFPACLTDTFGFIVGKTIGRKKLAPVISPHKTWEGFFGSMIGAVFGIWLATVIYHPTIWGPKIAITGLAIGLLAVMGDLAESFIKRSVGVKDSSHLIPGHGGVLDRLDALTFVAPLFYLFAQLYL